MQISLASFLNRLLIYTVLLVVLPVAVSGLWLLITTVFSIFVPVYVIFALQLIVGIVVSVIFSITRADVTAMAKREADLAHSQQQFAQLYDRSPVPYLTIDSKGIISSSNLAAVRLFKTKIEDLNGMNLLDSLVLEDETARSLIVGKLNTGVSITEKEFLIRTTDGSERWVLLSIFVYSTRSERLVAMVDITHQKTVDQAKSEFVALASHQLRTPIAAVRWNVELLKGSQGESLSPDQTKYYDKIESNVLRMIGLINDFLSVSKLETGTFATEVGVVSLNEFIDSVIDENQAGIDKKQLQLSKNYNPSVFSFEADTRLLHIIVNNLLSNAVKYVENGDSVSISYQVTDNDLAITVTDTGIGIPAGEVEKLFSKFYRATNARSHKAEGTGLGLYIVKQSVEMMGGTIQVGSKENVGTTFVVTVPVKRG